ncbi:MAG TPA: hypothetical protein PK239_07120 [Chitinophagales bacterium]|nr:hypothetical protein [Chitinophagales bacterium]
MRTKVFKIALVAVLFTAILLLLNNDWAIAQCPMCKAAAESNLKEGGKHALGLNAGILYLFAAPYLIVATLGFIWWRNQMKVKKEEEAQVKQANSAS